MIKKINKIRQIGNKASFDTGKQNQIVEAINSLIDNNKELSKEVDRLNNELEALNSTKLEKPKEVIKNTIKTTK